VTLGSNIRRLREAQGMSVRQLGVRLEIDHSAVSKWERDIARPREEAMTQLASVLGVTEAELHADHRDEYTYRESVIAYLRTKPEYAEVIEPLRKYRAKSDVDPSFAELLAVANSIRDAIKANEEPSGIGDVAPDLSPQALKRVKRKRG
jgi:transcriptional regulator with XRE-family HTH domain